MLRCRVSSDNFTFPSVVKACSALNNVRFGAVVHEVILSMGFEVNVFIGSSLINLYLENNYINRVRRLFDKMPVRDYVLWNVMLNRYVKCGELDKVVKIFDEMRKEGIVDLGAQLHGLVVSCGLESNSMVAKKLVYVFKFWVVV
ncbi:hypothetical protein DITRI_Ditri19aG0200200 [Diplodiscus trichospermus]